MHNILYKNVLEKCAASINSFPTGEKKRVCTLQERHLESARHNTEALTVTVVSCVLFPSANVQATDGVICDLLLVN